MKAPLQIVQMKVQMRDVKERSTRKKRKRKRSTKRKRKIKSIKKRKRRRKRGWRLLRRF